MEPDALLTVARTIGANIMSIKIYEHDGNREDDISRLKKQNEMLERQLEKMISFYRKKEK